MTKRHNDLLKIVIGYISYLVKKIGKRWRHYNLIRNSTRENIIYLLDSFKSNKKKLILLI